MFIQTEQTPNPATLKFLPGATVMETGTADFRTADAALRSPLAERLFLLDGVEGVFLGADFIAVTKGDARDWSVVKPEILGVIMEHYTLGTAMINEAVESVEDSVQAVAGEDAEIVAKIEELLETRVRPAVAQDGGDIVFRSFEEGIVYLKMQGACAGCPSSSATLKVGIENLLKHFIPEVKEVRPAE
ncbi:MAG: NifU family protein [Alphaproteobacteria bacterium]|jgi:Fe-S cluster biogenesis protein NfuA